MLKSPKAASADSCLRLEQLPADLFGEGDQVAQVDERAEKLPQQRVERQTRHPFQVEGDETLFKLPLAPLPIEVSHVAVWFVNRCQETGHGIYHGRQFPLFCQCLLYRFRQETGREKIGGFQPFAAKAEAEAKNNGAQLEPEEQRSKDQPQPRIHLPIDPVKLAAQPVPGVRICHPGGSGR